MARGAAPAYWHLDIDWHLAAKRSLSPAAFILAAAKSAAAYGIKLGVFLAGYSHVTDAEYRADVKQLATNLKAMNVPLDHLCVESWAERSTTHAQDIPNNLGVTGLLASLADVHQIFSGANPEPPPPTPEPKPEGLTMLSILSDPLKEVIAIKAIKPIAGSKAVTWILPNDNVYSCQPDGSYGERPPGTEGAYERNRTAGNMGTFKPADKYYTKAYVLVDGL